MSVTDLITAAEVLYTEISGDTISEKVAGNINDASAAVTVVLSLVSRNTSFDVDSIVAGTASILEGVSTIIKAAKGTTTTATTATS